MDILESGLLVVGILTVVRCIPLAIKYLHSYIHPTVQFKEQFKSPYVLITGANAGAGRDLSNIIARQGLKIIGVGRDMKTLDSVKKEVESLGSEFQIIQADLNDPISIEKVFATTNDKDIGAVILNAGYAIPHPIETISDKAIRDFVRCMLLANTLIAQHFLKKNKDRASPSAIYITASLSYTIVVPKFTLYSAAKAYLGTLFRHMRLEAEGTNVNICALHPGTISKSSFFKSFPEIVQKVCRNDAIWQTSESVAQVMASTIGRKGEIECGINGIVMRTALWILGEEPTRILFSLIIHLIDKYYLKIGKTKPLEK